MGKNHALIVDDHPFVGRGIANFLITHCRFKQAYVVTDEEGCYRHFRENEPPGLLVLDFWLPSSTALRLLKEVKQLYPKMRLLVISGDESNDIRQKVRTAGAHGFVLKSEPPEMFSKAVSALMENNTWFLHDRFECIEKDNFKINKFNFTPRQKEVLHMIMRGLPNKKIAAQLSISEPTVKEHISHILKKMGVNTRMEAITLLHGNLEPYK
ncbi:LuxR C-terminal-related transcriptional regulator [Enterobacter adelaidei]